MAVGKAFRSLNEQELRHPLIQLLSSTYEAEKISTCAQLHHKTQMAARVERVVQLDYVPMVSQVLEDLQVLRDLFLALNLLLHFTLLHCFYGDKVSTELVLGNDNLAKGALPKLVSDAIELGCRGQWLAHLLKVCHDHGDKVLFFFEERIVHCLHFLVVIDFRFRLILALVTWSKCSDLSRFGHGRIKVYNWTCLPLCLIVVLKSGLSIY